MSKCGDWIDRCKKKEKAFFLLFFSPLSIGFRTEKARRKVNVCKLCGENAVQNTVHSYFQKKHKVYETNFTFKIQNV